MEKFKYHMVIEIVINAQNEEHAEELISEKKPHMKAFGVDEIGSYDIECTKVVNHRLVENV